MAQPSGEQKGHGYRFGWQGFFPGVEPGDPAGKREESDGVSPILVAGVAIFAFALAKNMKR